LAANGLENERANFEYEQVRRTMENEKEMYENLIKTYWIIK